MRFTASIAQIAPKSKGRANMAKALWSDVVEASLNLGEHPDDGKSNKPPLALVSRDLELLAELGRILNAWNTEFTRAVEEAQVRRIEEN
jgi:hypothetical protein